MNLYTTSNLLDTRTNCFSVIYEIETKTFIDIIENAYKDKGGLIGQRDALKSSSALRIRKRMVLDIIAGTVLPPIVLGLIVSDDTFRDMPKMDDSMFGDFISSNQFGYLSIIDGMQRTTALIEALDSGAESSRRIRVEFWISVKLNSLIYRMLVLNTGQVPWNLRRQVETVFSSMISEIKTCVPELEIIKIDEATRRTKGGQFHANDVIELYLAFGGRKEKVDTRERLADEFTRLDFIEVTEDPEFAATFYKTLKYLANFDIIISRFQAPNQQFEILGRFKNGRDLFSSQPARVGFITATAKKLLGRPGADRTKEEKQVEKDKLFSKMDAFILRLEKMTDPQIEEFLALDLLSERLAVRSSRVGDFEREFFTRSFETFIDEIVKISSLDICWLSF